MFRIDPCLADTWHSIINIPYDNWNTEMVNWCHANLGTIRVDWIWHSASVYNGGSIYVKNDQQCTLFKLRWM